MFKFRGVAYLRDFLSVFFFLIPQAELLRCMDVLAENFGKESLNFLLQKAGARTSHVVKKTSHLKFDSSKPTWKSYSFFSPKRRKVKLFQPSLSEPGRAVKLGWFYLLVLLKKAWLKIISATILTELKKKHILFLSKNVFRIDVPIYPKNPTMMRTFEGEGTPWRKAGSVAGASATCQWPSCWNHCGGCAAVTWSRRCRKQIHWVHVDHWMFKFGSSYWWCSKHVSIFFWLLCVWVLVPSTCIQATPLNQKGVVIASGVSSTLQGFFPILILLLVTWPKKDLDSKNWTEKNFARVMWDDDDDDDDDDDVVETSMNYFWYKLLNFILCFIFLLCLVSPHGHQD